MLNRKASLWFIAAITLLNAAGCAIDRSAPVTPNAAQSRVSAIGKAACAPDFSLALSPTSATISAGQTVRVTVKLASLCGLAGSIFVGIHAISPSPKGANGFTIHQPRYDIPLDANSTAVAYITFGANQGTLKTTYTITIQGEDIQGGCCYGLTHSATFALTTR